MVLRLIGKPLYLEENMPDFGEGVKYITPFALIEQNRNKSQVKSRASAQTRLYAKANRQKFQVNFLFVTPRPSTSSGGGRHAHRWIPAFAGMTVRREIRLIETDASVSNRVVVMHLQEDAALVGAERSVCGAGGAYGVGPGGK